MTEPLLTARQALLVEGCLDDVVRTRPVWMGAWISGLLAGTLSTLPPDDPWRHIHARYKGRDFGDLFGRPDRTGHERVRDQPTWAVRLTRGPSRPDRPGVSTGPPCRPRARRCRGRLARSLRGVAHRSPVTERNPHTLRRPRTRRPPLPSPPPLACHRRLPGGAARRRPSEAGLPGSLDPDWVLFAATGMGPCDEVEHSFQPTWLGPDESVEQILAMLAPISAFDRWSWPEDALIPPDAYETYASTAEPTKTPSRRPRHRAILGHGQAASRRSHD